MMYCELDDIASKEKLDVKDVELIDKFVDIIKDINEIDSSQDMDGYSQMYMRGRSGRMMPMYRGRSMTGSYSHNDNKSDILDHLAEVADMAIDEKDRKAIERLMSQMSER